MCLYANLPDYAEVATESLTHVEFADAAVWAGKCNSSLFRSMPVSLRSRTTLYVPEDFKCADTVASMASHWVKKAGSHGAAIVSDWQAFAPACAIPKDNLMALERTFSIIKPDATARNLTGAINAMIEKAGLRIVAQKRVQMTRAQAETFYGVHRERPFFGELVEMMTAAPVVVQVLEGEDAIQRYRDVMGATNPEKAAAGTIRKDFALSMGENSVHGSDAPETAAMEIAQWFPGNEIVG